MGRLRRIGILGGMGPQATVLLQQRLIDAVAAKDDADHIPLLIDMNPQVPSRLRWLLEGQGENPGAVLAQMARRLEDAGAEALAMPCNTAHHFAGDIRPATGLPLLHMVEMACAAVAGVVRDRLTGGTGGGKAGILASPATERIGLFRAALAVHGIEAIHPSAPAELVAAIRAIKSGDLGAGPRGILAAAAAECVERGAGCLLIGCSEFSLIPEAAGGAVPVIDSLDVLVDGIRAFSGAGAADGAEGGGRTGA